MFVQQALLYGLTVGKAHWIYKEMPRVQKVYGEDEFTGELVSTTHVAPIVTYDGPSCEPWDVYDCWFDPNGRDVDSCRYIVLRSWPSKDDLLRNACTVGHSHDTAECPGISHNVPDLINSGTRRRRSSTAQEEWLGNWKAKKKDVYELWEVWRDNRLTVIGNQQILLRDVENPHWHGRKPVMLACTRPDVFQLQGIPETELVDHLQQALWTNMNLRQENMLLTVHRGITYRESGVIDPAALELKPRFKWPVSDHDDIVFQQPPPLPSEAYNEEQTLLGNMQTVTGITPYISGADMQGVDQNTATGVASLTQAASRLLQFKAAKIHRGIWQRTFELWSGDIQQFMDRPLWVRIVGPDGELSFRQVTPSDVAGDFDFRLIGTEEQLSRQQERTEAMSLLNAIAPLAQLGVVNMKPLLRQIARAFNYDDPEELLAAPPPQAPAAAPMTSNPSGSQVPMPSAPNGQPPGATQNAALDPVLQGMLSRTRA